MKFQCDQSDSPQKLLVLSAEGGLYPCYKLDLKLAPLDMFSQNAIQTKQQRNIFCSKDSCTRS